MDKFRVGEQDEVRENIGVFRGSYTTQTPPPTPFPAA